MTESCRCTKCVEKWAASPGKWGNLKAESLKAVIRTPSERQEENDFFRSVV